jgi:hypothetical protein
VGLRSKPFHCEKTWHVLLVLYASRTHDSDLAGRYVGREVIRKGSSYRRFYLGLLLDLEPSGVSASHFTYRSEPTPLLLSADNTLPSANTALLRMPTNLPLLAGRISTVTSSPGLKEFLLQPASIMFAGA